jgi:hypothetical protein
MFGSVTLIVVSKAQSIAINVMRFEHRNISVRGTHRLGCASVAFLCLGSIGRAGVSGIAVPSGFGDVGVGFETGTFVVEHDGVQEDGADAAISSFLAIKTSRNPFLPSTSEPLTRSELPGVQQLPAPPDSASVVLSGLLALAGVGVVRSSARHFHLIAFPDWYHPSAPAQIGHTTLFDWGFADPPLLPPLLGFPSSIRDKLGALQRSQILLQWSSLPSPRESRLIFRLASRPPPY